MREFLFKNITSGDKKRKDLFVSETVERNGIKTITKRHSIYIIDNLNKFNNIEELSEWKKNIDLNNKKHVFVVKRHDTKEKKDTFICDVVGKFYAVTDCSVYTITFKHSFEVDFVYVEQEQ
jgi:hypothetical protein